MNEQVERTADSAEKDALVTQANASVPAMPVIPPDEQTVSPYPVLGGIRHTIGWRYRQERRGGAEFLLMGRGGLGAYKVLQQFPLTEAGWTQAWQALAREDPESAARVRTVLADKARDRRAREQRVLAQPELAALDARSIGRLPDVALLGGYGPTTAIAIGERYDARFLDDRLCLYQPRSWEPLFQVPYGQVEHVEIGGPGLVKTGGRFVGGGFGARGALEGMAIAAVLNSLTTRTSITTIVRVQAASSELFLLDTNTTPSQLRMELSRPLGAIRAAQASAAAAAAPAPGIRTAPASPVEELAKLAGLLADGLINREEFDQLKARLLQG